MNKFKMFFAFLLLAMLSVSIFAQVPITRKIRLNTAPLRRQPVKKPFKPSVKPPIRSAQISTDLLIVGGTVVTMNANRQIIENGAIAIKSDKIVAIGTTADLTRRYSKFRTINAAGKAIIPGLINTHTHVPMTLFRGISDDLDLNDWLTKYIFPAEAKNVDEAFVRAGTRLGLAEMIRGGTTTYCDMYYYEDAIADE